MEKITEMFAYIAEDEKGEGVMAMQLGDTMFPMVGADMDRMDSMKPIAEEIAKEAGMPVKLAKFTTREDLEEIKWKSEQE